MTAGGNRTWRRTLALWAAVVAVCAGVGGATWAVQSSTRRAVAERQRQRLLSSELSASVAALHAKTLEEIEAALNGGRPLPRVPGPADPRLRVVLAGETLDPRFKGWEVRLTFFRLPMEPPAPSALTGLPQDVEEAPAAADAVANEGAVANGVTWSPYFPYSYTATPPPAHPGPSAWAVIQAARLRSALLVFGTAGWVIALLTLPLGRRWRRQIAQVMLACVLVAAAGWALEPGRSWALAAMTRPVPAALALGALVGLCALLAPARKACATHCENCGYDLTGNVSGVCPECGNPTPRGKVERWRTIAEQIEFVGIGQETDEIPISPAKPA
jgi:hypothetical protein